MRLLLKRIELGEGTVDEDFARIRRFCNEVLDDRDAAIKEGKEPMYGERVQATAASILDRAHAAVAKDAQFIEARHTAELTEQRITVEYVNEWER